MAVIAAMLAVDGVMAHLLTTEELLLQQKASDQWAYYQAKSIRRYDSEVATDVFKGFHTEATEPMVEKYKKAAEKYREDTAPAARPGQRTGRPARLPSGRPAVGDRGQAGRPADAARALRAARASLSSTRCVRSAARAAWRSATSWLTR